MSECIKLNVTINKIKKILTEVGAMLFICGFFQSDNDVSSFCCTQISRNRRSSSIRNKDNLCIIHTSDARLRFVTRDKPLEKLHTSTYRRIHEKDVVGYTINARLFYAMQRSTNNISSFSSNVETRNDCENKY